MIDTFVGVLVNVFVIVLMNVGVACDIVLVGDGVDVEDLGLQPEIANIMMNTNRKNLDFIASLTFQLFASWRCDSFRVG